MTRNYHHKPQNEEPRWMLGGIVLAVHLIRAARNGQEAGLLVDRARVWRYRQVHGSGGNPIGQVTY